MDGSPFPAAVETALHRQAVSVGKPEPEIFHTARSLLGPGRAAVIGDSPDTDILGGSRAGLTTILIGGRVREDQTKPNHTLPDLAALLT